MVTRYWYTLTPMTSVHAFVGMNVSFLEFVKITSFRYPKAKRLNPSAISTKIFEEKTFLFEIVKILV